MMVKPAVCRQSMPSTGAPTGRPGARAHLRAALLLLHLGAVSVAALPSAGEGLRRSAWKNPTVRAEFTAWADRLTKLGLATDPDALEDTAYGFARSWHAVHLALLRPFRPYYTCCGTYQSWRMFVAPHRYPARLHVDVDRGAGWEPIYVARSRDHRWRSRLLDTDRFRTLLFRYAWPHYRRAGRYDALVRWLSRQAARDFPDGERLRVRMFTYRTRSPEEVRAGVPPSGRFRWTRIRQLELHR